MYRGRTAATILLLAITAGAANPPSGQAASDTVAIAAIVLDAAAVKQDTGSDFGNTYTVIEVTLTPKAGKSVEVQPDDFLLRLGSSADHSGPLSAAQILGSGGLVLHKGDLQVIGADRTEPGWSGVATPSRTTSTSPAAVDSLGKKLLQTRITSAPVTGLLFFPIEKKRARDLDLVYSAPEGKLHIGFR